MENDEIRKIVVAIASDIWDRPSIETKQELESALYQEMMSLINKPKEDQEDLSLIIDHDFEGQVKHWSKDCDLCHKAYGKHVRDDIEDCIIRLEDHCYCEESRACHNCICKDMFNRLLGKV